VKFTVTHNPSEAESLVRIFQLYYNLMIIKYHMTSFIVVTRNGKYDCCAGEVAPNEEFLFSKAATCTEKCFVYRSFQSRWFVDWPLIFCTTVKQQTRYFVILNCLVAQN